MENTVSSMVNSLTDPSDGLSDSEIVGRVVAGNVNAYETIVRRYDRLVAGIVGKHVPRDRVDEVAQDVFFEGFRSLGTYSHRGPFNHWLAKIAVRCCYDFWREHHRARDVPVSDLSEDAQAWMDRVLSARSQESFAREAAAAEAREILDHALARLTAEDRMVVTLVHLDGLPVREAAALLGWSPIAVKVRAHRCRKKLHRIIVNLLEDGPGRGEVPHEKTD